MPSQILQNYLNDTSVDRSKREKMFKILQERPQDESQLEQIIQQKYKGRYGQSVAEQPFAAKKPKQQLEKPTFLSSFIGKHSLPATVMGLNKDSNVNPQLKALHRGASAPRELAAEATATGFEALGGAGGFGAKIGGEIVEPFVNLFSPQGVDIDMGNLARQGVMEFSQNQADSLRRQMMSKETLEEGSIPRTIGRGLGKTAEITPSIVGGMGITQGLSKAPLMGSRLGQMLSYLGGGGATTTGAAITGEGRLPTVGELGTNAAIDVATLGAGKLLSGLGKRLYSRLVPTNPTQRAKDLKLGFDLGDEMSKIAPITANEQTIVRAAQKRVGELSDELLDQVRNSDTGQKYIIDDFLEGIKDKVIRSKNLKATPRQTQLIDKQIERAIAGTKEALGGRRFSLEELHRFKQDLGSDLAKSIDKLVRDGADASITAPKIFDLELQKSIKNTLENNVSRYKSLNKKMSPLIASYKRISSKAPRPSFWNNMLSSAGTGTIATLASGGDVETGLKAAILGAALPSIAGSPLTKTLGGRTATMTGEALQSPVLRGLTRGLMFGEEQAN